MMALTANTSMAVMCGQLEVVETSADIRSDTIAVGRMSVLAVSSQVTSADIASPSVPSLCNAYIGGVVLAGDLFRRTLTTKAHAG